MALVVLGLSKRVDVVQLLSSLGLCDTGELSAGEAKHLQLPQMHGLLLHCPQMLMVALALRVISVPALLLVGTVVDRLLLVVIEHMNPV